jgi:DNA-binding NtrC family response regulator
MATILIIDDEKTILGFLEERFMDEGFNVLTAIDGIEGLKLFNNNQIDFVITDIIMPSKGGIETIIEMKTICPKIQIIAMSGGGHNLPEGYLGKAKHAGAKYTFAKPFKTSDLVTAVYELLEKEKVS